MIDLHAHILPGVDDGPATLEEALAVLRAAAADGTQVVAATPHVRDDYPTTPAEMERGVAELRRAVERNGIPIRVVGGGEIALERLHLLTDDDLRRFALARHLLVETPYVGWPLDLTERLFPLQLSGFTPVLAHPERNAEVQRRPDLLRPLVEREILVQITAASVDGRLGSQSAETARRLLAAGLAHLIASDAHGLQLRHPGLSAAASALRDDRLARWLLHDVPLAIVDGGDPPPRPAPAKRRFAFAMRTREDREHA